MLNYILYIDLFLAETTIYRLTIIGRSDFDFKLMLFRCCEYTQIFSTLFVQFSKFDGGSEDADRSAKQGKKEIYG